MFNSGTETALITSWFKTFCTFLTFKRSKVPSVAPQLEPHLALIWLTKNVFIWLCIVLFMPLQPHQCSLHSHLAAHFTFTPLFTRHYCLAVMGDIKNFWWMGKILSCLHTCLNGDSHIKYGFVVLLVFLMLLLFSALVIACSIYCKPGNECFNMIEFI